MVFLVSSLFLPSVGDGSAPAKLILSENRVFEVFLEFLTKMKTFNLLANNEKTKSLILLLYHISLSLKSNEICYYEQRQEAINHTVSICSRYIRFECNTNVESHLFRLT